MTLDFSEWMRDRLSHCEEALHNFLPSTETLPRRLHEGMHYASLNGGKRIRPLLTYAAAELFRVSQQDAHPAAIAVELIHAYSLVHDDMPCMDNDVLRRGKPTVHVQFGEANALLVGDALQAQAFLILSQAKASAETRLAWIETLAHAAGSVGMCGGQAIDLDSVGLQLSLPELETMHRLKTGAILRAAVVMGAYAGKQLSNTELEALDVYARAIGLAFQVVDDVLDAVSDSTTLGKTAGKDAADNKPTYVSLLGLDASRQLARDLQQQAHNSLAVFGEEALRLHQLADLIVERQA